ncbi:MAG: DUF2207 domain-containing protein [Planctomycetaceae bacterium]
MRRVFAISGLVLAALAVLAGPARAAERITDYRVWLTVGGDGALEVREVITYDFGTEQRHGIYRDIPTTLRYDGTYDRSYPLTVEQARIGEVSGAGSSDVAWTTESVSGGLTRIKIGDPDRTVTGVHTYELDYRVDGALNAFADHLELYWNAIGTDWPAPIAAATVHVQVPGRVLQVACFAGPDRSGLPCDHSRSAAAAATFSQADLWPYQGLTVVVSMPRDAVRPTPAPILVERLTFTNAFRVTPGRGVVAGALALLAIGGASVLVWRVGRDRRFRGSQVDQVMGGTHGDERVPVFDADTAAPVEFEPPEGIRPGQIGPLMQDLVVTRDASVTIVDLAVRGYLRIEEIPKEGFFGKPDWRFVRLQEPRPDLLAYERSLLEGLFADGDQVTLSSLRLHFADRLSKVTDALYADLVKEGWFRERPDRVRARWRGLAFVALAGSVALTWLLATRWHLGIVGVPVLAGALVLWFGAKRAPARTARGTAMLRRVRGFRTVIVTAEANVSRWAEQEHVFTRYLPYAMVFGCTEEWVRAFSALGQAPAGLGAWYVSSRPFAFDTFGHAMDGFTVSAAGTLAAVPAGSGTSGFSGGGFSGGGGGGGGGGSW